MRLVARRGVGYRWILAKDTDMPHWHDDNPWADRVVYVPLERLAAVVAGGRIGTPSGDVDYDARFVLDHWRQSGDRLDAYLLPGPAGMSAGVRHGAEGSEYYSPGIQDLAGAEALLAEARAGAFAELEPTAPFSP